MHDIPDAGLLEEFARSESEEAFAALVQRHLNLVYSTALRNTGHAHAAEEITQAVFIVLARRAGSLGRKTVLAGWLYHTARLTAANWLRAETRRIRREQEAFMQSTLEESPPEAIWAELSPHLDNAMAHLGATDRDALVLRYFQNKSLSEVGEALGVEERAAQKRVTRALEKLRKLFSKRGVTLTAALIAGAVSANSVQAAPVGLAATVTATTAKGVAVSGSTLTLVKGVLKFMAWTKAKTAIVVGVGVLLAAGTTTVAVKEFVPGNDTDKYFLNMDWEAFQNAPPYFIVRPTHFNKQIGNGTGTTGMGSDNRAIGRGLDFETMIHYAYNYHNRARTVLPAGPLPEGSFDYLVTVPGALGRFQAEVKRQFGYAAHKEVRDVDAWVLRVKNAGAPGLKPSTGDQGVQRSSDLFIDVKDFPFHDVVGQIESSMGKPVIDETGLRGNFDIRLDWKGRNTTDEGREQLKQAVLDQLGLELVATNLPVEMLVVEQEK
jgi:uncharacterized protein (TIGR03435 family)